MPKLLEETIITLDRADLLSRSPIDKPVNSRGRLHAAPRSSGMHLSGVLRYIAVEGGLFKNIQEDIDAEELPVRMALGLAWEEFAVSLYPEIAWQPGETEKNGIHMTCDGIGFHKQPDPARKGLTVKVPCLEEFKLTWKKVRTGEEMLHEWYWMQQGRGYCWGYDIGFVRWHVCYINGDYRGSGPIYKRYLVSFSDLDVESTRNMIVANTERAKKKGHAE